MKKMKRFFALFLAMAMVLGMSMTVFAADPEATITVKNVDAEVDEDGNEITPAATLQYVHAIVPDRSTPTGWNFNDMSDGAIAMAYTSAFGVEDPQVAIIMLAKAVVLKDKEGNLIPQTDAYDNLAIAEGVEPASSGQINTALSNIAGLGDDVLSPMNTNPMTVTGNDAAGIYVIKAEQTGYTYQTMSAYVGFGEAGVGYPALQDAEVTAKKADITISKENLGEAADNAVAVGDTVEFEVKSNFPYVDPNADEKSYIITDILTGATFNEGSVVITIGSRDYTRMVTPYFSVNDAGNQQLEIDLSGLIDDGNSLANAQVVITYSAVVTEVSATNTVNHEGTGITNSTPATTNLYTGSITITKYAEDGNTGLNGAEFVVARYSVGSEDELDPDFGVAEDIEYATFDDDNKLTGWVTDIDEATRVVTNTITVLEDGETKTINGVVTVNGLDQGAYLFIEVKAPEGYSINDEPSAAVLEVTDTDGVATQAFSAETEMIDTTLSALPATGGIGTTIFTVGGCAIMIVAAGLFFVSRRKASR